MSVRLVELDLAAPGGLPDISIRHAWIRVLIRLNGAPIGFLQVRNTGQDLDSLSLGRQAVAELAAPIWAELEASRLRGDFGRHDPVEAPAVSVVVCTRDRAKDLDECLSAVSRQSYPEYEVIVVDNASKDESARLVAARWSARYVREDKPGLDWARNRGFAVAQSPIVAYTDDDARPDPGWLRAIAAGFSSADVEGVTGLVVPAELETRAQGIFEDIYGGMGKGFQVHVHTRRGREMTYRPERIGVGCNMAFRRATLARLGGFDPALDVGTVTGGGGDLDMFQRLMEGGGVLVYRPDAIVRHTHRRTLRKLRRQLYDNGRGYSSVLWASLLRARGLDRARVFKRYWVWIWSWHLRRVMRKLRRREQLPMRLVLAELVGAPLGPVAYSRARRAARRMTSAPRKDA